MLVFNLYECFISLEHYAALGDFQSLSTILCMFPYKRSPKRSATAYPTTYDRLCSHGGSMIQAQQIQRSASNMRVLSTSPATSLSGRSPPDKHSNAPVSRISFPISLISAHKSYLCTVSFISAP